MIAQHIDWIFGYGSLVWRPAFDYSERRPGYIEGWARRFWQLSPDHRGTPEAPGRVVTLVPKAGARCLGMAFRLPDEGRKQIIEALDHREKAGYSHHVAEVTFEGESVEAMFYVANADNPNFAPEPSAQKIAEHVVRSQGPSGDNTEYVLELDQALRALGDDDQHVRQVADAVRRLTTAS